MEIEVQKCAKDAVRFLNTIKKFIKMLNVAVAGWYCELIQGQSAVAMDCRVRIIVVCISCSF
jgi:hypothetical protein